MPFAALNALIVFLLPWNLWAISSTARFSLTLPSRQLSIWTNCSAEAWRNCLNITLLAHWRGDSQPGGHLMMFHKTRQTLCSQEQTWALTCSPVATPIPSGAKACSNKARTPGVRVRATYCLLLCPCLHMHEQPGESQLLLHLGDGSMTQNVVWRRRLLDPQRFELREPGHPADRLGYIPSLVGIDHLTYTCKRWSLSLPKLTTIFLTQTNIPVCYSVQSFAWWVDTCVCHPLGRRRLSPWTWSSRF